jgi:gliding motility-associated-like protein
MNKKFLSFAFLLFLFIVLPGKSFASHVSGGEVTYTSLGGNQYKVELILYWDCGSFDPGTSQSMNTTNSCNLTNLNFTVDLDTTYEVSQVCPSSINSTTCNGGSLPGNKKNVYSAIITLPGGCSQWTFYHESCCRNISTNVPTQPSYTIYATLNNQAAPNNNSPYFTSQPLPYLCVGQPVCYSPGVVELDGNSLTYSFVDAMDTDPTTPVTYGGGYSGTSPMPGITIDPNTGLISFTPTMVGNFVVTFLVVERNSSGVIIGSIIRDIQMVVVNCSNQVIACNAGAITNLTGFGATQTGPNSMQICENIPFSFTTSFTDPDAGDILSFTSNILQVLPGAVITSTGTNPITISVSWTAPAGSANTNTTFALTVADNACPVKGQQTVNYIIDVLSAAHAGPDQSKCGNQSVQLNATGPGTSYTWSVLSGPPIVVGTNFSCNPCQNPIASPTATTQYLLTCNGSSGCVLTDTVIITVVPNFTYSVTQSSANTCLLDPVQLNVTSLNPAGTYTYQWSPATYLSSTTTPNPTATITTPGSYTYTVNITSAMGCIKTDSITVVAVPAVSPVFTARADTSFCPGGVASLSVNFGNTTPVNCGLSNSGTCSGTGSTIQIGNGTATNTMTGYPAPYGNYYTSAKHQFLYTAAELTAAGLVAGKIDQLDFNVTTINGITTYHQYEIKMGCTNLTSFSGATNFETGLYTVFPPQTFNVTTGWNSHIFSSAFEWNGTSNVVVEISFSEGPPDATYTDNCISPYTVTSFVSCLYLRNDNAPYANTSTTANSTSNNRPNIKFHNCSVVSNPANFSYLWAPASGNIANANAQNTTASPTNTTTYTVTVTNTAGGCSSTDVVQVTTINISTLTVSPAGPYCVNSNIDTLQVSVPTGAGTWSGPGITNTSLGIFNPSVAGPGTHRIIYNINSSCGNGADTIFIVVNPPLNTTITPVGNICASSGPITLTAATAGGVWAGPGITNTSTGVFDPAVAGVGNHVITYTISTPCLSQSSVLISVILQLDATITHTGPYCATLAPATLTAVDPGGVWSGTGITDPALGIFDPEAAGPGSHVVTYVISGACGASDTDTINVIPSPTVTMTSDTNSGCEPTTIKFYSTTNQPGGTCLWYFGDGNTAIACDSAVNTYPIAGPYSAMFVYTNSLQCRDTSNIVNVTIYSNPEAAFSASPQPTTILDPVIHFQDQSSGLVDTRLWIFKPTGTSTDPDPIYTYPDTGTYNVKLIVSNIHGCVDSTDKYIVIDPILVFYAPTAFSPNDNGKNDTYKVYGEGIEKSTFQMLIFDRWGDKVFQSNDYNEGWNGARNNTGEILPLGVYVWKVTFKDFDNKKHQYLGHVTLVK